jgi:hypothetical protein
MSEKKILNNDIVSVSTGKLGVGTTSPNEKLEVSGEGNVYAKITSTTTSGNAGVKFLSTNAREYGIFTDGNLRFYDFSASAERMRITQAGNVGIGTTSPGSYDTAKVGSSHRFLNVQAPTSNYAVNTLAGGLGGNGDRIGFLTFVNDTNSATYKYSAWIGSEVEGTTANKTGGRLVFSTTSDNSTAGPIERMRITADGNVGIGTTTPDAPLTVHSSTDPEIRFGYSSTQDHRIQWDSSKVFIHADPENANAKFSYSFVC